MDELTLGLFAVVAVVVLTVAAIGLSIAAGVRDWKQRKLDRQRMAKWSAENARWEYSQRESGPGNAA